MHRGKRARHNGLVEVSRIGGNQAAELPGGDIQSSDCNQVRLQSGMRGNARLGLAWTALALGRHCFVAGVFIRRHGG